MEYRYEPEGVCSQEMIIEVDGDTIKKVTIQGGCAGNTVGVSRLIEGMKIQEAIKRLKSSNKFETLDETLKEIAEIRLKNPNASLIELGKMLKQPVGKSGVNYRLKKIMEIANEK